VNDYGFRIYNPSIAKFLSVDPLTKGYPMLTPYQFASNSPIVNIDLDGLESIHNLVDSYVYNPKTIHKTSNYVTDVISGVGEVAKSVVGAAFQLGDRWHGIGNKWDDKRRLEYYSMIGDKNECELLAECVAAPIIAGVDFFNDPYDGYKMGVFLGTTAPFVKVKQGKKTGSPLLERPPWQASENFFKELHPTAEPQVSFLNRTVEVYGTKGTARPEMFDFSQNLSIEVKNWKLETVENAKSLAKNIADQINYRTDHLPLNAHQKVYIDVRGQNVTETNMSNVRGLIEKNVTTDNYSVEFIRDSP